MYEQFRNHFTVALSGNFSNEVISIILDTLDRVAFDYEIRRKNTKLIIYNEDLPEVVKTYLVCKKMEGLSDGTLENYTRYLRMFFKSLKSLLNK